MKKSMIRRLFEKWIVSDKSERDASGRHPELENLEPRMLFSAAPVEAPDAEPPDPEAEAARAAEESVIEESESTSPTASTAASTPVAAPTPSGTTVVTQAAAKQAAVSLEGAELEGEDELGSVGSTHSLEQAAADTAAAASEISEEQNVTLVNVDGVSAGLNQETLDTIAEAAKQRWIDSGGLSVDQVAALDTITYQIADLDAVRLGAVDGTTISVDGNAWGHGWFVDSTPLDDSEFGMTLDSGALSADGGIGGQVDLLTVLLHEQGHILGLDDLVASGTATGDVASSSISAGTRLLPTDGQVAGLTPGAVDGPSFVSMTFGVTNLSDSGAGSLRQAILDANANADPDFIEFTGAGVGQIDLLTQLTITDDVTINSNNAVGVIVNQTGANERVFEVQGGTGTAAEVTVFQDLTISGGNRTNSIGGGVYINGWADVTFDNVLIDNNSATEGGGFYVAGALGAKVTLTDSDITNNSAVVRGGGFRNSGFDTLVTMSDGKIDNNFVNNENGGGFYNNGQVILSNVDITNNSANDLDNTNSRFDDSHGGGFFNNATALHPNAGRVTITGGSITDNTAFGHGGGFWNRGGIVTIDGKAGTPVEILRNQAGAAGTNGDTDGKGGDNRSGGGFWASDAATTKLNWVNFGNGTDDSDSNKVTSINQTDANTDLRGVGGGFYNASQSKTWLNNVDLSWQRSDQGGAFYQDGIQSEIHGTNVTIDNGFGRTRGGGFRNATTGALVDLKDSSIDGGIAYEEHGGGVYNNGTLNLDNTDISNSVALDFSSANRRDAHGGGLYNGGGTVNMTNGSDIRGNATYGMGGGLYNTGGVFNMTDGVIDDNKLIMDTTSTRHGGGFWNQADSVANLHNVTISNNETGRDTPLGDTGTPGEPAGTRSRGVGGGFWNTDGSIVNITGDSQLIGNRSEDGGAFYNTSTDSVVNITGTKANPIEIGTMADPNTARVRGGGFRTTGNTIVNLEHVDIQYNTVDIQRGGGFYADSAQVNGNYVRINNNATGTDGRSGDEQGGGFWVDGHGWTTLNNSEINDNFAFTNGGGFYANNGVVDISDSTVEGNFTHNSGGGFFNENSAEVHLTDVSLTDNIARDHGGGFWSEDDSKTTILRTNIDDNLAGYELDGTSRITGRYGGGFWARGRSIVTIDDSTVDRNEASVAGGAVFLDDDAHLIANGTTFAENVAGDHGGGFRLDDRSTADITNSTISNNYSGHARANTGSLNVVHTDRVGGGLWTVHSGATANLNHTTVAENRGTSTAGAGLYRSSGTINIENTLVHDNLGNVDAASNASDTHGNSGVSVTLSEANVIGVNTGGTLQGNTGGLLTGDPGLGALADNGGPTLPDGTSPRTHTITAAMSADEAATGSTVAVDQLGNGRSSDIGAYELASVATTLTIDDLTIPDNAISGTAFDVEVSTTVVGGTIASVDWSVDAPVGGQLTTGSGATTSLIATNPTTNPVQTVDVTVTVTSSTGQTASETRQVRLVDIMAMPMSGGPGVIGTATVTIATDGGAGSLRDAISAANASGAGIFVIEIAAGINPVMSIAPTSGTDNENGNVRGDFDITKSNGVVSIVGLDPGGNTIDGAQIDRVFDLHSGRIAYFTNLTITGGETFTSDRQGGALYSRGGTAVFKDVDVDGNAAAESTNNAVGGAFYLRADGSNHSATYMTGGSVTNNTSESNGGGIYFEGTNVGESILHLDGTTIGGNTASFGNINLDSRRGGGIYMTDDGNRLVLNNVSVEDNQTIGRNASDGGGLAIGGANHTVEITDSTFVRNKAGDNPGGTGANDSDGGGFWSASGRSTYNFTNVAFGGELAGGADATGIGTAVGDGNVAEDDGGAFYTEGRFNTFNFVDTTFIGNLANDDGGGFMSVNDTDVFNFSQTAADLGVIRNNVSLTSNGGGFRNAGATVNITGTAAIPFEIRYNEARGSVGGGFYTSDNGNTNLTDVVIRDNVALNNGGGFYNNGGSNVTITSSVASTSGTPGSFVSKVIDNKNINANDGGGFYNTSAYSKVNLTDVLVSGNSAIDEGGGFYASSNFSEVNLTNVDLTNNTAQDNGGGFYNASNGSIVNLENVLIDGNVSATEHGGGFRNNGIVDGKVVTISNNVALNGGANLVGGGFYNEAGRTNLVDVTVSKNHAGGRGGGFYNGGGGIVEISSSDPNTFRSIITDNKVTTSSNDGGGFYNVTGGSTVILNSVDITNNSAGDQGGGFHQTGDMTRVELDDVTIDGNVAGNYAGGFRNDSAWSIVTLNNTRITDNTTTNHHAGGIWNRGSLVGQDVIIDGNVASTAQATADSNDNNVGGGLWNNGDGGYTNLTRVEITNNESHGRGGGVYNDSRAELVLTDFIIKGNSTDQDTSESQGRGGGIWNSSGADVFLNRGEVSENTSFGHGGGIYSQESGATLSATNVTFSGNQAGIDPGEGFEGSMVGGGFWAQSNGGTVYLDHTTFSDNKATRPNADAGAGFRVDSSGLNVTMKDSVAYGNSRGLGGTVVDDDLDQNLPGANFMLEGNNIIGFRSGNLPTGGSGSVTEGINAGNDPGFQPLADNGGATLPSGGAPRTHALTAGASSAIDAATSSTLTEDQRGLTRTAPNDIGAFEADVTLNADDLSTIIDNVINLSSDGTNAIVVVDGVEVLNVPVATLSSLNINGQTGDDQLTVDYTGGFDPLPAGGLFWNGDDNTGGAQSYDDHLIIDNGAFTTVTHNPSGPGAGTIDLDAFTAAITYTGLESNAGTGGASAVGTTGSTVVDFVFNLPAGGNTAQLIDLGTDLRFDIGSSFEVTDFADPTGSVTVNGGAGDILLLDTPVDMGTTDLIVSGGTLTGDSSVSGPTTVNGGGVLRPGTGGVGDIATGGLTLDASSDLILELGGTGVGASDQVVVTGTVDVTDSSLSIFQASGYTPVLGDTIILIDNDDVDAVTGTFAGLPEGTFLAMDVGGGSVLFTISYVGGDGNDVAITSLGMANTTVTLSGTTLTVIDTIPLGTEDNLHISVDGDELVITDPDNVLGSVGPGIVQPDLHEIRVKTSLFTDLNVMTLEGDDLITIGNLGSGGTGLQGGITVNGGDGFDNILYNGVGSVLSAGRNAEFNAEEIEFGLGSDLTTTDGDITVNGTGGTGSTHQGIHLYDTDLTANGAGNTITLNGSGGDTGNSNQGVFLTDGSTVTTANGNIDIDGVGGGNGVSVAGQGVMIYSGSSLSAGGSGTLTINGTGGPGTYQNEGVLFDTGTSASVENGAMTITGTGNGTLGGGIGVSVIGAGLSGTGTGNILINGTSAATGGSNNSGVELRDSTVNTTAGSGSVTISGSGSGAGKDDNMGVSVRDTDITAGGSGTVTIDGTGGSGEKYNHGVHIDGAGSSITSVSGPISINGTGNGTLGFNRGIKMENVTMTTGGAITLTGTGSAAGTQNFNTGIFLSSGNLSGGTLTITGHGGTGASFNEGVRILEGSLTGALNLDGTANTGTTGIWNSGVYLLNIDLGSATGTIDGTGGGGMGFNHGIYRSPSPTGLTENGSTTDSNSTSQNLAT